MASQSRQIASQNNGKKGRGPKTELGKSRASKNAYRHGLSIAISDDPTFSPLVDKLGAMIAGDLSDEIRLMLSRQLAEAQFDIMRIRKARTDILADDNLRKVRATKKDFAAINRSFKAKIKAIPWHEWGTHLIDEWDAAILAIHATPFDHAQGIDLIISKLNGLERYERRALSRRNRALHALHDYNKCRVFGLPWPS
jgi:hypothetical protein